MQKNTLIFLLTIVSSFVYGQKDLVTLSVSLKNATFSEFVTVVEKQTLYHIQYNDVWVKDLEVSVFGVNLELSKVLNDILQKKGLNFYIDKQRNIIIYPGERIVEKLPDYFSKINLYQSTITETDDEYTEAEKNYIEGKKFISPTVIKVGEGKRFTNGKRCAIRGKITDQETGHALIGATVYIENEDIGAATDIDGYFNLILKQGEYEIVARSMSMKEKKFYLDVYSDGAFSIAMEKENFSIKEVKVVVGANNNVTGMQMGFERMTSKSIKNIPVVMGEQDILKIAQMLPGVQSAGEGSSGLNVRGGTADQNMFYINKIPIYNTSHLFGFFSAFSSDVVNAFSLYKSNIPAKYGGRLSSIFDINTRSGNKKELYGKGGISFVTGHMAVEGPIKKDKSTFVLNYRGTYSDWLLSKIDDIDIQNSNAAFYDLSASFNTEINQKNSLKTFFYRSKDEFSLASTDDYYYENTGVSVNWKHLFSSSLNGDVSLVHSQYLNKHNGKDNPSEAYTREFKLNHSELRADLIYNTKKDHLISFGVNSIFYHQDRGDVLPFNNESSRVPIEMGKERGVESALYVSDEFSLLPKLKINAGLRFSMFSYLGAKDVNVYYPDSPIDENNIKETKSYSSGEVIKSYSSLEPRLSLNYQLGINNSVKASYNRNKQYVFMLSNTIAMAPTDMWKLADYHLKPPVSNQLSIGYYHNMPESGLEASVEVYKKYMNNIVEYKDGVDFLSGDPTEMLLLQGNQDVEGLEFMLKKPSGVFSGRMSYTYSKSMVKVDNDLPSETINNGRAYPSNYDRPHSFNLTATLRSNMRLSFSTIVDYSTGRPITYPITSYQSNGQEILYYSDRNGYRIPDYFRVDLSVNLEGNLRRKKAIHSFWTLNIYNVTGRKNAYSVYYESNNGDMQAYKLSIFGQPIVSLSWNFKFGNYAKE
ncbi:TonB-dependent receptor [Saccharicrinis sp. 156]|uniref:TonB-dependent receptor n=1 Tax=Saccharicrinis sp. 156 TaxID=3417574 RepID=UPI003D350172